MMEKLFVIIFLVLIGGLGGFLFFQIQYSSLSFADLNPEKKYQRIIEERDLAIQEAVENNIYQCCLEPPCTMCYLEANQWNNFQAGTCACDELIAEGKEPCPQCKKGLCQTDEEGVCEAN
jgi:hypothetical protein